MEIDDFWDDEEDDRNVAAFGGEFVPADELNQKINMKQILTDAEIRELDTSEYWWEHTPHEFAREIEASVLEKLASRQQPLSASDVEQILARWSYEIHGDRARYIVRETEAAHGIREKP
jgi:hypothetical protein